MALTLPRGLKLVAATHNPGKAVELAALLEARFNLVSAGALSIPEPDETETTFAGNAILKARHAAEHSGLVAIADDSGLSITALDGAPGIYSARWAGPDKDFGLAMQRVGERLTEADSEDRSAWFTCALAVAWPNGPAVVFEGRLNGVLTFPGRGMNGFGYDPIFTPLGQSQTFSEMEPPQKDAMSHRARAFAQLKAALFD